MIVCTTQLCSVTQHTHSMLRLLIHLSETTHLFRHSGLQPTRPIVRTRIPASGLLFLTPRPPIRTRIPLRGLLLPMFRLRLLTSIPMEGLLQQTLTLVPLAEKVCDPPCWLHCPLPMQVQGGEGAGGGGVCLCPIPTLALPLMRLFVRYVNTVYVNSFSYLMHFDVWITMAVNQRAYCDGHAFIFLMHGRAVQLTSCSKSLLTPEHSSRQAYARITRLKRSASTTRNKQKSIMRVFIC
jgi:hypothetical protein